MNRESVLVVGAGVGGLAVSSYLRRLGHEVTVYEQAEQLGPVGAGILLPPAGQHILAELGVLDGVAQHSATIDQVRAEQASGKVLLNLRYETLGPGLRALGTPRGVLFEALRTEAERCGVRIQPASRVNLIEPRAAGACVRTQDGRSAEYSFVVVADGSRSEVGESLGLRQLSIEYAHQAVWTTGDAGDSNRHFLLQRMNGVRRLSGLLPLGDGQASFFWGVHKDEVLDDWERFRTEARELMPEAGAIIDRLVDDHVYTRVGYRTTLHYPWYRGDVVLLGDAAHSMSPHLGQGASLALVDAARLARALRDSPGDRARAFETYQRDRFWRSLYYVATSLVTSPFFQSRVRVLASLRNTMLPFLQRFPWIERQMVSTMSGLKSKIFSTQMTEDELSMCGREPSKDQTDEHR